MTSEEKLRDLLKATEPTRKNEESDGRHLRDEDFIKIIEEKNAAKTNALPNGNASLSAGDEELAVLRGHLAKCDSCLAEFKDFYAFFAPAESGETEAGKSVVESAWKSFAPRIESQKVKSKFWTRLFSSGRNKNYFGVLGWGFAALLLIVSGISVFVLRSAYDEKSQLARQLEQEKQTSEERLKTLEQSAQNSNVAEIDKSRLQAEKDELQKQIAQLQTEIERVKQSKSIRDNVVVPPSMPNRSGENSDNSLVAVNTPIYDVFPAEAIVRGDQTANKLVVPNGARSIVLILNTAGRADFPVSNFSLTDGAGKTVSRGSGLRKDATGNFTLTILRTALKTGNYRLQLSGKDKAGAPVQLEYPVNIEIKK